MRQLKAASLLAILTAIVATAAGPAAAQAQLARAADPDIYDPNGLYGSIDTNNDGQFDLAEYTVYVNSYAQLGDVTSINIRNNDGYEGVFRHYDVNRDGQLSREELARSSRVVINSSLANAG